MVLIDSSLASYIEIVMDSPLYWSQLISASAGTGQPNVNSTALGHLLFPIPPVNEQKRIKRCLDELSRKIVQMEDSERKSKDLGIIDRQQGA